MPRKLLLSVIVGSLLVGVGGGQSPALRRARTKTNNIAGVNKSTLFILSIGICEYHNYGRRNPKFADKDARDFAGTLERVASPTFANVNTTLLLNAKATRAAIIDAVARISVRARPDDTFVFFYSGHGTSLNYGKSREAQFYLLPSDFDRSKDKIADKGISAAQLQYWLIQIESNHEFVILDSSKSDGGFREFRDNIDRENQRLAGLARRDIVILSVKSWSFEFDTLRNGLLTYVLLRGLEGSAVSATGEISVMRLASYVNSETPVVFKAKATPRARQIVRKFPGAGAPFVYTSGEDFVLGAVRAAYDRDGKFAIASDGKSAARYHHASATNTVRKTHSPKSKTDEGGSVPDPRCETFSTRRPSTSTSLRKGKDIALLIAVNDYAHWPRLLSPVMDAEAVANVLHDRFDFETEVLKNPPRQCIDDAIERYKTTRLYEADDQLLVFFSGHGFYNERVGAGYLIVKESLAKEDDTYSQTATPQCLFRRMLTGIGSSHLLLVVDACFSGSIDEAVDRIENKEEQNVPLPQGNTDDEFIARVLAYKSRQFITSGDKEYVSAGNPGEHSPFASQLLLALRKDNSGHGFITLTELSSIIKRAPRTPRFGSWDGDRGRGDFLFFLH